MSSSASGGGTTFTFVTDGITAALELARRAAGDLGCLRLVRTVAAYVTHLKFTRS